MPITEGSAPSEAQPHAHEERCRYKVAQKSEVATHYGRSLLSFPHIERLPINKGRRYQEGDDITFDILISDI